MSPLPSIALCLYVACGCNALKCEHQGSRQEEITCLLLVMPQSVHTDAQGACFWRTFHEGNHSVPNDWAYGVEGLLHEQLLQSPHRTLGTLPPSPVLVSHR